MSAQPKQQSQAQSTSAQRATIRALEREGICSGPVERLADCGWAVVCDGGRELRATVDRSGTLLALEGPGRRRRRRR